MNVVATVAGAPVLENEVDAREARLRATRLAAALPSPGTSEGRQLRRWLTQLLVTERVVAAEVAARGLSTETAPGEGDLMPDTVARMELGSVAASVLENAGARALFVDVTKAVTVPDAVVADYHVRNPGRFAPVEAVAGGWHRPAPPPSLDAVRPAVVAHLRAAACRREFRRWVDAQVGRLVDLAPGYEHPGDPRQPDNTHRH
jgi:[acyl-carrier-protein] S-malonyltransferase